MRWIFCFVLFALTITLAKAQHPAFLQKEIEFPKRNYSLQEVFDKLEAQDILIAYNNKSIDLETNIHSSFDKLTVYQLLQLLKNNYEITSKVKSNKIIFTKTLPSYTLSGYIKEFGSGETLVGANISLNSKSGTSSNAYGFYSLTLPKGKYKLNISYIGYVPEEKMLILDKDINLDINLKATSQKLSEVTIKPKHSLKNNNELIRVNLDKTNRTPLFLGADDAIKRLQMIPGAGGGISGFSDITVRGGDIHENLVLLDGVPVYNYNHFPGILSIFNTDAIKSIDFYKGQFPARYVGRLSSVTDIKMREGNMETYHIGANINLATISMFIEGPILKNKASFIASARRSWIDGLTSLGSNDEKFNFHLQDINLKMNYLATKDNRFYLSFYKGTDKLGEENETLSWSNNIIALRWNHTFSDKIFTNTLLSFSEFDNTAKSEIKLLSNDNKTINNRYLLNEFNLATDIEYYGNWNQLRLGVGLQKNTFKIPLHNNNVDKDDKMSVIKWKAYMENKINFSSDIYGNIGLNYVLYQYDIMTRHFFQPRINLIYQVNQNSSLSASFSEMYQFIHQLGSYSINFPYAFRLPASETFLPGISILYELRYISQLRKKKDNFSASLYYKWQKNILRYKPGQDLFNEQLADDWRDQVLSGQRKILGLEVAYFANLSPLLLNFSYTFSKNEEQFPSINNNQYYPNALTPTHILILTAEYSFNKKHSISIMGEYNTGRYMSIPIYEIENIDNVIINDDFPSIKNYVYGNINGFQLKDNYRIDLGYTFQINGKKYGRHILKTGFYSLLGKAAPFRATSNVFEGKVNVEEVALPSPMPYVSYTFKF